MTRRPQSALLPSIAALLLVATAALLTTPPVDAARKPAPSASPTTTPTPTPTASAATSAYLEGIDVSEWQGTIDWTQVVAAGKQFAFVRASAGTLTADQTYAANHREARRAGMTMGAYHYANPGYQANDAVNEADWFLLNASLSSGDLLPVLDVEVNNGLTVPEMQAWVAAWLERVRARTNLRAIIYTSPSFWATYMGDTRQFADQGYTILWVAHWTRASAPTIPAGDWGGRGWTFWQYSSKGSVTGIAGSVDLDRYNGSSIPAGLVIP